MAARLDGPRTWTLDIEDDGNRTYTIVYGVETLALDGPAIVANTAGLPQVGATWALDNDVDIWAFCTFHKKITPRGTSRDKAEPNRFWNVEQKFSTRFKHCSTDTVEDPLLLPQKTSGSFVKYTQEATLDRFGHLIESSSHEQIRGPEVERDYNRPTVRIEQNVFNLDLDVVSGMVDTVNDSTLWGLGPRKIKLANFSWEGKHYGACYKYYTRTLEFDINFDTFDQTVHDQGTKVLNGAWNPVTGFYEKAAITGQNQAGKANPDPSNPNHFIRFKDRFGENARCLLDGAGMPADSVQYEGSGTLANESGPAATIDVQFYDTSNFLLLNMPVTL